VGREARRLIREARSLEGLDDEIALLRLIIRDCFFTGNDECARRTIAMLARVLLAQVQLKAVEGGSKRGGSQSGLSSRLAAVLDRLGAEPDD
jgi:hypothetical protein